jgi:hypothetical protein
MFDQASGVVSALINQLKHLREADATEPQEA